MSGSASLFAADPPWLYIEKGKQYLRQQELGNALNYFRRARETGALNADANFYIGLVYEAEQNLTIAKRYYREALDQAASLYTPSDIYLLQYQLAYLYWLEDDYFRYETQLKEILVKDADRIARYPEWTLNTARNVLIRGGIDRLGILFRLPMTPSFYASRELGAYLATNGRDTALDALLVAYVQGISLIIENIKIYQPDFQYATLEQVLSLHAQYDKEGEIAATVDIFKILYYLGLSLQNYDSSSQSARELLTRIVEHKAAGKWSLQASTYLESKRLPLLEELIPGFPAPF